MAADCIFCKIVAGVIPSHKLAEDDLTLAFMDINPAHPGHSLVIAKEHAADLFAVSPAALQAVALTAQRVARAVQEAVRPDGLNLLQANGPGAAQSVGHFHMHVLPRRLGDELAMNWGLRPGDGDEIARLAERIRALLSNSRGA